MADDSGKKKLIPSKIMAGLAICVLLGLGLCGASTSVHLDKLQTLLLIAGSLCFWGGLILLILFAAGWAIFEIAKSLFGKKD